MKKKHAIIIGGGMAGLGATIFLLEHGFECTLLEAQAASGGLAGSFQKGQRRFPLGYHHILAQDAPLIRTLKKLGLFSDVVWKKGHVCFTVDGTLYDLEQPMDFLRFPLPFFQKMRFAAFMLFCFLKKDWTRDLGNAQEWLDRTAGKRIREMIFDPLMHTKYGLPSEYLSANWLGSRLHYREFSRPLGYIPGHEWTHLLVTALSNRVGQLGGRILTNARVERITLGTGGEEHTVQYACSAGEKTISAPILINTAPPHIFRTCSSYQDDRVNRVEYLDALSLIMEINEPLPKEFYLLSSLRPAYSFGGIFVLSTLNETMGVSGKTVLNFFTTLGPNREHMGEKSEQEITDMYLDDFEKIFSFRPTPIWRQMTRIKNYSPKFLRNYQNINPRGSVRGLYFAGNYLTYPTITSTGSAIQSGEETAQYIIEDYGT